MFQYKYKDCEIISEKQPIVNVYHLKTNYYAELDFQNGTLIKLFSPKKWALMEKLGKMDIKNIIYHSSNGSFYPCELVITSGEYDWEDVDYKYIKKKGNT